MMSTFPWRRDRGSRRHDKEIHDRHGIPRCKHCGGPSEFVRFSANQGKPRLWFRCMIGVTDGCAKGQTIACSKDWRLLVPLWRTDPLYHELKASHKPYEAVHDWWRDRYKVAADHLGIRPKARGYRLAPPARERRRPHRVAAHRPSPRLARVSSSQRHQGAEDEPGGR